MKRLALTLVAALVASTALAGDAIIHLDAPGQTLYARVFTGATTSVAAALTEGTGNGAGRYVVTDATLSAAGLSGTAVYPFKIFVGTPSTSADDANVAVGALRWASTAAVDPLPNAAAGASSGLSITSALTAISTLLGTPAGASVSADIAAIESQTDDIGAAGAGLTAITASLSPVSADVVGPSYTWIGKRYRATNIVEVGDNFDGPLALQPDVNPGVTIATVDSVSITGAATVTATTLTVDRTRTRAHFTVPTLTTTGTYTVVVTVTTVDGQTIPTTATLKVY